MDDDFFKKFDRKPFDFDSDFSNVKFSEPDFTHTTHHEFHHTRSHSFDIAEKAFFIFFGIVVTFIIGGFIFAIFIICFRLCKGESFHEYRRARRFPTVIPPPPLSNQLPGTCKSHFKSKTYLFTFSTP